MKQRKLVVDETDESKTAAVVAARSSSQSKKISREEPPLKKRKKERSKSRDRKRRKDKKHKKERASKKKSKEKESAGNTPKDEPKELTPSAEVAPTKTARKNPKLVTDRKRSVIDEANFVPDYSATESESEDDDRSTLVATKRGKINSDEIINVDAEPTVKSKKKTKVGMIFRLIAMQFVCD